MSDNLIPGVEVTEDDLCVEVRADVSRNKWVVECPGPGFTIDAMVLSAITVRVDMIQAWESQREQGIPNFDLPPRLGCPLVIFDGERAMRNKRGEIKYFDKWFRESQPYGLTLDMGYQGRIPRLYRRPSEKKLKAVVDLLCRRADVCVRELIGD